MDKRVWIITTAEPHQRVAGNRVNITDQTQPDPSLSDWNNYFEIEAFDPDPTNPDNQTKFKITFDAGKHPDASHSLVVGTIFQAFGVGMAEGCIIEDNAVSNTTFGGPYADTYNIKEVIVRRNHYWNVLTGVYIANGNISHNPPRNVTLTKLNDTTAQAYSPGHGFGGGEEIRIRQANNSAFNAVWTIGSRDDNYFQFPMDHPPDGPDSTGFAVDNYLDLHALSYVSGGFAEGTTQANPHTLEIGDRIKISKATPTSYNGLFELTSVTTDTFQYKLPPTASTASAPDAALQRFWGIDRLVVENNIVELAQRLSDAPIGIVVNDNDTIEAPDGLPPFVHGEIIVRNNVIRIVDGGSDPGLNGFGIYVVGAKKVIVSDNVLDLPSARILRDYRCGNVEYSNNRTSEGALILGSDFIVGTPRSELELESKRSLNWSSEIR